MSEADLGFTHRYEPGATPDSPTLVLLHGTGGNEDDLVPLGPLLAPGAAILSPRGKVLEHGMPRFFRRLAEGVFDLQDLRARTDELGEFIIEASRCHQFDLSRAFAVGFSNGANIAASLLLLRPGTVSGAILFRAMVPIVPDTPPDLSGTRVFLANGRQDPYVPTENAERLAALLRENGAEVTQVWQAGGHELTRRDVSLAHEWLVARLEGIRSGASS